MGQGRESHDALGNMLVQGHPKAHEFPRLSVVYNSLSRPLSLLWEPLFDLNKRIIGLVFPLAFFQGFTQNYWCSYVLDLVSLFMLPLHVLLSNLAML